MKICSKCGIEKEDYDFSFRKDIQKLRGQCRDCKNLVARNWRTDNDEYKKHNNEYQKKHRIARSKDQVKEINQERRERYNIYGKEEYIEYRDNIVIDQMTVEEYNKNYLLNNKTRICKCCFIEKNINDFERGKTLLLHMYHSKSCKECEKEYNNLKAKKRLAKDPLAKLRSYISGTIYQALKENGDSKRGRSVVEYLSFSIKDLKEDIETKFSNKENLTQDGKVWMNWDNQGIYNSKTWNDNDPSTWTWQLDHIVRHSTFKYSSMEDQAFRDCWALSNLRPLSAKQNNKENYRGHIKLSEQNKKSSLK